MGLRPRGNPGSMDLGKLIVRGTVGPLFIGHGAQKLFGAFGGHGLEGTGGFFESALGLKPGKRHATAAGVAEFGGGLLLTLGALTPVATTAISATMVTAIRKVHGPNGPWVTENGWEYNAVLIAVMTALADAGAGRPSVDAVLFPRLRGHAVAAVALGAAVAGSYLATSPPLAEADDELPQPAPGATPEPAASNGATATASASSAA
jgi:putative oxidoreductase